MDSLFLLGAPRSGSSVVAGLLARSGFAVAEELHRPTAASPSGGFESGLVQEINEALISSVCPPEPLLLPGQYWLAQVEESFQITACDEISAAMQRVLSRPCCLKDSRFLWTLPNWLEHSPSAKVVCSFRSPV
ncbi:MAG: hypothetical protein ACI9F9_003062, partial [Candidatus Paceibacteria bacterium]